MVEETEHAPAPVVDINADLGEGYPNDAVLLDLVTSTGVCCGAHGGDPGSIRATLEAARSRGVAVGADPGYPDREGFGRRERAATAAAVAAWIVGQTRELARVADELGLGLRFVKPHGALYNQAQKEETIGAVSSTRCRRSACPCWVNAEASSNVSPRKSDTRSSPRDFPTAGTARTGFSCREAAPTP